MTPLSFPKEPKLNEASPWQPIESAPKFTEVLVWREDSGPFIAQLSTPDGVISQEVMEREKLTFPDDFEEWFSDAYGWQEGSEKPTHWMPLPAGPDAAAAPGDMAVSLRDAKDAERYRWLRSDDIVVGPNQREIYVVMDGMPHTDEPRTVLIESELDAAIDAAILATEGG